MQIEVPCPKCRNTRMKFPRPQPIDSDIITCFSCNFELGTYGSIKKKMVAMLNRVAAAEQQKKKH